MKQLSEKVFLLILLLAIVGTLGLLALGTKQSTSFFENRSLASLPSPSSESVLSGEYFNQWDEWFLDHIKGRNTLLKLNTALDLYLYDRPVVNDQVVSSDVLLLKNSYNVWDDSYLLEDSKEIAAHWKSLSDYVSAHGGSFYYLGLPYQTIYFYQHYPSYLADGHWYSEDCRSAFFTAMEEAGVTAIDMTAVYEQMGYPNELYSAVDHHYTYWGAFAAYQELMRTINDSGGTQLAVLSEQDLIFTTLPNPYLGSSLRKLYGIWENEEKATIATLVKEIPFTRIDNGQTVPSTLYAMPSTDTEYVTYNIYMGGDVAETILDTGRDDLPKLLLFGDSFSNPLETLLYASFGETRCLDLRYYTEKSLLDYIAEYQPDVVICVRDSTTYYSTTGNGNFNG